MSLHNYQILGLDDNYTLSDIKTAYYQLSRIFHPDSNSSLLYKDLSKEDKSIIFNNITNAYKELVEHMETVEFDCPIYTQYKYDSNIHIEKNDNIKNLNDFNEEFEKKHAEANYDNPWSIYYTLKKEKNNQLDILRPTYIQKSYYGLGINQCYDFGENGKNIDLDNFNNKIINEDTCNKYDDNIDDLLKQKKKERETIEFSEDIQKKEIEKKRVIEEIENNRRQIQLERDIRILRIT